METEKLCVCGCGLPVNRGCQYRKGHYVRTLSSEEQGRRSANKVVTPELREKFRAQMKAFADGPGTPEGDNSSFPLCACGCGEHVRKEGNLYIYRHQSHTQAHKDRASKECASRTGTRHTEEVKAVMKAKKRAFFDAGGEPWNKRLTKEMHPSVALHSKGRWNSTEAHYALSFPTSSTRPEAAVQIELVKRGIPFLFNVPIRGLCRPDFCLPFTKIVIQVDGAYWHRNRKDKDAEQDAALSELGWFVFRWDEDELSHHMSDLMDTLELLYASRFADCQGS